MHPYQQRLADHLRKAARDERRAALRRRLARYGWLAVESFFKAFGCGLGLLAAFAAFVHWSGK